MTAPKTFLSYSWTSPEYEERVLKLAEDLRASGVDAILDKWDLKEGQEANAFMEKMVTDHEIKKVLILADKTYVEKSDQRKGGAGTEAQIISKEIFNGQDVGKFAVVSMEIGDDGKPCTPSYYTSRIFIDFTDPTREAESFERIIRWIFDKPLHRKPEIGEQPRYLQLNENSIRLGTDPAFNRAIDALQTGKGHAVAAAQEFLELFTDELEKFRIPEDVDYFGDKIMDLISETIPYRNQVLEVFHSVSRYSDEPRYVQQIHKFFERVLENFYPKPEENLYREIDFDILRFLARELFLHSGAIFLEEERYDLWNALVGRQFFDKRRARNETDPMRYYGVFSDNIQLLENRNSKLNLRRYSLAADLLHERITGSGRDFEQLMEVDLILYLRGFLHTSDVYSRWYPETLLYAGRRSGSFCRNLLRGRSKSEFTTVLQIFGVETAASLDKLMVEFKEGRQKAPRWGHYEVSVVSLTDYDRWRSQP